MKKHLFQVSLLCAITAGSTFGTVVFSNNPLDFADPTDWCQFGCLNDGSALPTPQPWTSTGGATGLVGLDNSGQGIFNLQQSITWGGTFGPAMGLVYNGVAYGNTPAGIAVTFDAGHTGVGAFIEANTISSFTAKLELFDINFQSLGVVIAPSVGNSIFIGAYDTTDPVWAVTFQAVGAGTSEPDFAIGTMRLDLAGDASTPEPSPLLTVGLGMLGFFSLTKLRLRK